MTKFLLYRELLLHVVAVVVFYMHRVQGAWLLINIALFTYQYWNFQATDKFYYMRIRTRVCLFIITISEYAAKFCEGQSFFSQELQHLYCVWW